MKIHWIKECGRLLLSMLCLTACQDDIPPQEDVVVEMEIEATMNDFLGPETRVVYEDYTTSFASGDEIGILAIKDNKVVIDNVRATYDGHKWTGDKAIAFISGAKYMAYFPYQADLNTRSITSAADITKQFDAPSGGQTTLEEYKKYDVLVCAEGTLTDGNTKLKCQFTHAKAMLEIILPRTVYKMTIKKGTSTLPDYYVPQATLWYISDGGTQLYEATPNGFRCIVEPGHEALVYGGYYDAEGNGRHYSYKLEANTLSAGECRRVVVDGGQNVVDFKYSQGDFFMQDGTLVAKDDGLTDEQKEQCIGVVVYPTSPKKRIGDMEQEVLRQKGVGVHGYVVSLKNAYNPQTLQAYTNLMWGPYRNNPLLPQSASIEAHLDDVSGLANTLAMKQDGGSGYVCDAVDAFNSTVPAPSFTTGWFLPSLGQWHDMIEKFGEIKLEEENFEIYSWSYDGLSYYHNFEGEAYTKIHNRLLSADIDDIDRLDAMFWTSTQMADVQVGTVKITSQTYAIWESGKGSTGKYIRCFLAF